MPVDELAFPKVLIEPTHADAGTYTDPKAKPEPVTYTIIGTRGLSTAGISPDRRCEGPGCSASHPLVGESRCASMGHWCSNPRIHRSRMPKSDAQSLPDEWPSPVDQGYAYDFKFIVNLSPQLRKIRNVLPFLIVATAYAQPSSVPELSQLKIAAEAGDPVAEFSYGQRVVATNPAESLTMLTKSADQEYGPAEDAVGAYYFQRHTLDPRTYLAQRRMSVRWTSRAAFKGIPEAQGRLSEFYEAGDALPKNAVLACEWLFVAIKTSERAQHTFAVGVYKNRLDRLVANSSSQVIAEGQKFADSFALQIAGMNPVEADLIIAQFKLTAVYGTGTNLRAVINHTSLKNGDTAEFLIDGESVHVSCLEIKPLSAHFQLTGTRYRFSLPLGR